MYMSSDACCMEDEDEDQSSSQGDCVSKILVCKYMTCQSAADVCLQIHGYMQLLATMKYAFLKVTPSGTLASPHSSEDDSDCHNAGQSKGLSCISFFTFLEYKTWYIFNRPFITL